MYMHNRPTCNASFTIRKVEPNVTNKKFEANENNNEYYQSHV